MYQKKNKKRWVAVSIKPNQISKAEANLRNQRFNYLAPKIKVTKRQQNRFINKIDLLFPGYIFVLIDEDTDDARRVRSTYGVSDIVRIGSRLGSVPDKFIEELTSNFDMNTSGPANTVVIGQKVEIVRGPFSGLVAELVRIDSTSRVKCLFDLISGKVGASVLMDDLIGIDPEEIKSNITKI